MVNRNSIQRLIEDIESDHEVDILTEYEVFNLFQDHGAEGDVDSYLYNTTTPTLSGALEFLGY